MKDLNIFKAFTTNNPGIQVFIPADAQAYANGEPCNGWGIIRYWEGSIYTGDLYFDGKEYNKIGFGKQEFTLSDIGTPDFFRGWKKAFYIGQFDYTKTDWIYGNGIMYYTDLKNQPVAFMKGWFEGDQRVRDWEGEFDPAILAFGYTPDMDVIIEPWKDKLRYHLQHFQQVKSLENLWLGDSYLDLFVVDDSGAYTGVQFYDMFSPETHLNMAVGGTKYSDWLEFLPIVDEKKLPCPKNIFVNLGFNDLHHGQSVEEVFANFKKVLAEYRKRFPSAKFHFNTVCESPRYPQMKEAEEKLNELVASVKDELGFELIDMRSAVIEQGKKGYCYHADEIHLNPLGYEALSAEYKKILGK